MGLTFKENCADVRNSGVKIVIEELNKHNCNIDLFDPWADDKEIKKIYGVSPNSKLNHNIYDGIIIAVGHEKFKNMGKSKILKLCKENHVIFDLKYLFSKEEFNLRLWFLYINFKKKWKLLY